MTCHDFQRKWNELFDSEAGNVGSLGEVGSTPNGADRDTAVEEVEALLLSHAAECPACRPIALGYQTLRHAIRAWGQPPVPPADLVQRVLSAPAETTHGVPQIAVSGGRRLWREARSRDVLILCASLAACCMIAVMIGLTHEWKGRRDRQDRSVADHQVFDKDLHSSGAPKRVPDGSLDLHRALAEATSATLDLARSASEPAARISQDMLDTAGQAGERTAQRPSGTSVADSASPDEGLVGLPVPLPSLDPLGSETMAASRVLQQVGDQLSAGAAPLSSTARHAFGFLLGPPRAPDGSRAARSTPTGA
jgi:hypothetical protein